MLSYVEIGKLVWKKMKKKIRMDGRTEKPDIQTDAGQKLIRSAQVSQEQTNKMRENKKKNTVEQCVKITVGE